MLKHILGTLAALAISASLAACGPAAQTERTAPATGITVSDAWASPTPGGVAVSAGYMTITNNSAAEDRLLAVTSPRANTVDVHRMSMEGAMMQMRPAGELAIPAGGVLTLSPNGLHLMFNDVTSPFTDGETIPLQLHFEHGGDVDVAMPVRAGAHSGTQ